MPTATAKYLSLFSFSNLTNWSVQYLLDANFSYNENYPLVKIGSFLSRNKTPIDIEDGKKYKRVTIKINNGGVYLRDTEKGENIGTKKQYLVKKGQFVFSRIDARNGAFGFIPTELKDAVVTNDFPVFDVDNSIIKTEYLVLITTTKQFIRFAQSCSSGTTNRQRIDIDSFLNQEIPLPSLEEQNKIVEDYNKKILQAGLQEQQAKDIENEIEEYIFRELGIEKTEKKEIQRGLNFIFFKNIKEWGIDKISNIIETLNIQNALLSLETNPELSIDIFRGKSPKYDPNSSQIILNQKCNRWNEIELEHAKNVDKNWFNNIESKFFTQQGDIIINSTGEGTIGRASYIDKKNVKLLYDSHILLLRLNPEYINSEYYVCLFNSTFGQNQVNNIKSAQSTKQTELGIGNLKKVQIPLPPLSKQNEIVNHIDKLKKQIKDLRLQAAQNREQAISDFEKEIFS